MSDIDFALRWTAISAAVACIAGVAIVVLVFG